MFAPGFTTQTISVPIISDLSDEPNETFTATLSGPSGAFLGSIPATTVTITDDDNPLTVVWQGANTNVSEAASPALVPVVLSAPSAFTITVAYATSDGTATAGSDYTTSSGTLTFAPSQTALNISIPITNDATAEPNETVTLTLSSPSNATLGSPNPATLTIVDNDGGSSGSDEYEQYDALGNLLQKGATAYTYGATASSCVAGTPASKPHAATSAGAASYTYDCDGNILNGGGRTGMLWDTENRLTSVTNGVTETYGYDADGERITRTTGGVTTVYLGGRWEETSAGAVKQYYPFNGTVIAVRDSSAGVSYLHGDHLGSVSATSGATSGPQTYGPWGDVTSGGSSATARNYTGQYLDSTTGLLYYHARYYDPALARFVSADSVIPGQADKAGTANPQNLNRYSYVLNNPLIHTDPTGQMGSEIDDTNSGMPEGSSSGGGYGGGTSGGSYGGQGCACTGNAAPAEAEPVESWENEGGAVAPVESSDVVDRAADERSSVDLTDERGRTHILEGERYQNGAIGGGHRYGTGFPGKSEFPENWSDTKIIHEVSDVATDPKSTYGTVQPNGYQTITGTRDGVKIKVI